MTTKTRHNRYNLLPADTWKHIRQLYESGLSPAEICRRFRIKKTTLFSRRRREGWELNRQSTNELAAIHSIVEPDNSLVTIESDSEMCLGSEEATALDPVPAEPVDHVRSLAPNLLPPVPSEYITQDQLRLARDLRARIEELIHDLDLGAGTHGRRSRAAVDLATAVEKIQKIERTAMGVDKADNSDQMVGVILATGKLSEDEWLEMVAEVVEE